MDLKKSIENISNEIDDVKLLLQVVQLKDDISLLERDLILAKLIKAYDQTFKLMKESNFVNTPTVPNIDKESIDEKVVIKTGIDTPSPVSQKVDIVDAKKDTDEQLIHPDVKEVVADTVEEVQNQEEIHTDSALIVEKESEEDEKIDDSLKLEFEKPVAEVAEVKAEAVVPEQDTQQKSSTVEAEEEKVVELEIDMPQVEKEYKAPTAASDDTLPFQPQNVESVKIMADKFGAQSASLNDGFEGAASNDVSSKLQQKPIADLTKGIGLNDRFLFTRELFGGKAVKYDSVIAFVNKAASYAEAAEYLANNYQLNYEDENVKYFMSLVARRHI